MKEREYAIDFLKFFAAILITNSHLDALDPAYLLSTGGSIGDVLFFFCSGYTLFMGRMGRFDNWYKRRLIRIFPPILVWGILAALFLGVNRSIGYTITQGGGWFVQCILIYYIFAYPIRKYATNYLNWVFAGVALLVCVWYVLTPKESDFSLYGWNYCKWAAFFLFFLQGAAMGLRKQNLRKLSFSKSLGGLLFCIILWYLVFYYQYKISWLHDIQIISLIPLLGVTYFFFQWCKSDGMNSVFNVTGLNQIIKGIGGLCYEIYLVQITLLESVSFSFGYPMNIIAIIILILLCAYILHVCSNFFLQTFRDSDYDWKAMLRIY